ncbi:MAG TPA: hypothetical protein VJ715_17080, partial [Pyrinomonadaceae bacterium]|nr:hypothetical protein [Pyrinomonadaceae bacterium]
MLIDLSLTYENGFITAVSRAALYQNTRRAILTLSTAAGEKDEKFETLGESPDTIMYLADKYRPRGSH